MGSNILNIQPVQGHIDSSFEDPRWLLVGDESQAARFALWVLGDDPDGPCVICLNAPPNPEGVEAPAHSHDADQVRLIVEGSFRIGTEWYRAGDIRFQEANRIYGPTMVGPEGCKEILLFNSHRAIVPKFAKTTDQEVMNIRLKKWPGADGNVEPAK